MNKLAVFSGTANIPLTQKIVDYIGIGMGNIHFSRFPGGEIFVKIEEDVRGKDVFVIQPTSEPPNENLMELLIILDTLRRSSARRITAVLPFYGYARQDRKDQPRVPITAKLVANLITTAGADRVLTMDLHASQIQGFFDIPLDHLFAVNIFVDYFKNKGIENVVVVSSDVGGVKMARAYAKRMDANLAIVDKRRVSDTEVETLHIMGDVQGKNAIIVDDLVATAGSLVEAVGALKKAGALVVYAAITHPVLAGPAISRIEKSSLMELAVTDTIPLNDSKKHPKIKVLTVASLLGEAIKRIHNEESVSSLFTLESQWKCV
ncbi:MAG: ribose-phosphate pyrophosphokinase [Candidatus Omnitrophica bacterium]|nr:ribose-phosphate pyrophosphokinase [Candidatus Omnitrophota bacterium]